AGVFAWEGGAFSASGRASGCGFLGSSRRLASGADGLDGGIGGGAEIGFGQLGNLLGDLVDAVVGAVGGSHGGLHCSESDIRTSRSGLGSLVDDAGKGLVDFTNLAFKQLGQLFLIAGG